MGEIVFYEGNGASQDIVITLTDEAGQDKKLKGKQNDEARSTKLLNVRAGCVISVFDDPNAARTDDFCIIQVKRSAPEYVIRTFERSYEDEYVLVSYANRNGLDGKVSRIKVG